MTSTALVHEYAARLTDTLPRVRHSITQACAAVGRSPESVRLVAVTKGHPLAALEAARDAGLRDFGENRVAELASKVEAFGSADVRWHMIGHIQRRKVPDLIGVVDLIHSLDSLRLAQRVSRVAEDRDRIVDVLVQINTSGEDAKGGLDASEAREGVLEVAALPGVTVRGLMTMAPFVDDEGILRSAFRALREILADVRVVDPSVGDELSMGMTNDLRFAVEEGSTMVRIGTALFGTRPGTG
ncbi:MAG: YggS family pyridoxal phosphate-dependent enzyme [Gemmatimonadetes bacterium]|nr:YggS family pyridoxal phosphate-dependent enzyme [Gemmatimonadota bacterium]MBT8404339.1 YggS family pyridoxal phosphate-dependent enzyme [Gemmatimonadota bacterium]